MFTIREAVMFQELEAVGRLRYEVYCDEMQRSQAHADHARRVIREPFDEHGHNFYAISGSRVIGCIRSNLASEGPLECEDLYRLDLFNGFGREQISMTTKFMVRREFREHPTLAARLAMHTFDYCAERDVLFDFIDSNAHLLPLYAKMGYRPYQPSVVHPDYGEVTPLVLVLDDVEHFERVQSPFRRTARRVFGDGPRLAADFFRTTFARCGRSCGACGRKAAATCVIQINRALAA